MRKPSPRPVPASDQRPSTCRPLVPEFDASGLCLLESQHASDFRMGWTRHPFLKVITALRGRGDIRTPAGAARELSCGRIAVVPPGVEHRLTDREEEPLLIYILCVGPGFPLRIPAPRELRMIHDPAVAGRALRELREIASLSAKTHASNPGSRRDGTRHLLCCGLTATLLGRLLAEPATGDAHLDSRSRVAGFLTRLRAEFFLARSTDEAASELRMSRRRFTQLFSEVAGETYAAAVQRLRIEHACRLLEKNNASPLTVAFETGFAEPSTFYRLFKKHTNLTPSRWAKRHKSNPVAAACP